MGFIEHSARITRHHSSGLPRRMLGALLCWAGLLLPAGAAADMPTAFVGVHVLPMDTAGVLDDQTVIIRDGKIDSMGPRGQVAVPKNARVIRAPGAYLMPGLMDMHVHIGFTLNRKDIETVAEEDLQRATEDELFLFVAHGITTVRNMQGGPYHLQLRERVKNGSLIGPRIYTAGPMVDGVPPSWPGGHRVLVPGADVSLFVKTYLEEGYDYIKAYSNLSHEMYQALLIESQRQGAKVIGHVPRPSNIETALRYHQNTIDHLQGLDRALQADDSPPAPGYFAYRDWPTIDPAKLARWAKAVADAGVWMTPTLVVLDGLVNEPDIPAVLRQPGMEYISPARKKEWQSSPLYVHATAAIRDVIRSGRDNRLLMVKALRDAGVPLMLGSDAVVAFMMPGPSAYVELQNLVTAGLTPYEALAAGTVVPGRHLGLDNQLGVVKSGAIADLVLLSGNPLENIAAINSVQGVMLKGRWLSRGDIDQRLRQIQQWNETR